MPTESLYTFVIPILILFTPVEKWTSNVFANAKNQKKNQPVYKYFEIVI